jgi:hypothetical protein
MYVRRKSSIEVSWVSDAVVVAEDWAIAGWHNQEKTVTARNTLQ